MSSPHMSFRLNEYQLARALRILITLEPNQPIASLSQAAKLIIIDWISKHSINASLATSQSDIEAIKTIIKIPVEQINPYTTIQSIMNQAKLNSPQLPTNEQLQTQVHMQQSLDKIKRDLEDEKLLAELKAESLAKFRSEKAEKQSKQPTNEQIEDQINQVFKPRVKPSEFHDPNITESTISTVTDFSPPKEWLE